MRLQHIGIASFALLAVAACNYAEKAQNENGTAAPGTPVTYTEPRFPAYLKQPDDINAIMPSARAFVRNKAWRGGLGLGAVKPGETVLIVHDADAEPIILEAIGKAAAERKFTIIYKPDYELVGVTKEQARAYRKVRQSFTAEKGYMEAANWIESWWLVVGSRWLARP